MGQRAVAGDLVYETARIICEEAVIDYRSAKNKAAQRLGLGPRAAMPDNAKIQAAVIDYQRLYGGAAYLEHLQTLRRVAVQAMQLLAEFSPRLVGAAVTGAVTSAHRVQLHAFADKPELLDLFLQDRGIPYEQDERRYRYPDGKEDAVPLARFEAGKAGVDVAIFNRGDERRLPLSPTDGMTAKRLSMDDVQALLQTTSSSQI